MTVDVGSIERAWARWYLGDDRSEEALQTELQNEGLKEEIAAQVAGDMLATAESQNVLKHSGRGTKRTWDPIV